MKSDCQQSVITQEPGKACLCLFSLQLTQIQTKNTIVMNSSWYHWLTMAPNAEIKEYNVGWKVFVYQDLWCNKGRENVCVCIGEQEDLMFRGHRVWDDLFLLSCRTSLSHRLTLSLACKHIHTQLSACISATSAFVCFDRKDQSQLPSVTMIPLSLPICMYRGSCWAVEHW